MTEDTAQEIREYFLPQNYSLPEAFKAAQKTMPAEAMIEGVVYHPTLVASAQVRVIDRKLGVESEITRAALVAVLEKRGSVRWDEYAYSGQALENVDTSPVPSARFSTIDAPLNDTKIMTACQHNTQSLRWSGCEPGRVYARLCGCRPRRAR